MYQLHGNTLSLQVPFSTHKVSLTIVGNRFRLVLLWSGCSKYRKAHYPKAVFLSVVSQLLAICRSIYPVKYSKGFSPSCWIFFMDVRQKIKIHQNFHFRRCLCCQIIWQIPCTSSHDHYIPGTAAEQPAPFSLGKHSHISSYFRIFQIKSRIFLNHTVIQEIFLTQSHPSCAHHFWKLFFKGEKFFHISLASKPATINNRIIFFPVHTVCKLSDNKLSLPLGFPAAKDQDFLPFLLISKGEKLHSRHCILTSDTLQKTASAFF